MGGIKSKNIQDAYLRCLRKDCNARRYELAEEGIYTHQAGVQVLERHSNRIPYLFVDDYLLVLQPEVKKW